MHTLLGVRVRLGCLFIRRWAEPCTALCGSFSKREATKESKAVPMKVKASLDTVPLS